MEHLFHSPEFVSMLCGIAAFAVVVLVWQALLERDPLPAERLKSVTQRKSELQEASRAKKSRRIATQRISLIKKVVSWFNLRRGRGFEDLRIKLARAGFRSRDAISVYLFFQLAMAVILVLLGFFFLFALHIGKMETPARLCLLAFAAGLGWSAPGIFVKNEATKRENLLRKSMPDALDLLVICSEAGLSLNAAFDRVSQEMNGGAPELAEELSLTSVELNFLPDRASAIQNLAERVPLPGVVALVNTLMQTEKYGTPLAQALRVLSAEMREERIMRAEEKAARLPAILTVPMIIFILPPLFVVLIGPAIIKVIGIINGTK